MTGTEGDQGECKQQWQVSRIWIPLLPTPSSPGPAEWGSTQEDFKGNGSQEKGWVRGEEIQKTVES